MRYPNRTFQKVFNTDGDAAEASLVWFKVHQSLRHFSLRPSTTTGPTRLAQSVRSWRGWRVY